MNDLTTQQDISSMVDNGNIMDVQEIIAPKILIDQMPLDEQTADFIATSREIISNIIHLKDDRLLVITGPCSIHNPKEALQIAEDLKVLQEENPHLYIVMRTYFEKPRTTVGWKWLLSDPHLDGRDDIEEWLKQGRKLLMDINKMWIPTAVEFLDTITPQYIADLVHWGAIWARTTESQERRKLVSGLSMPVGFKNGTKWNTDIALDAIESSSASHRFLWATKEWRIAQITTKWNPDGHVILRGGSNGPNYEKSHIDALLNEQMKRWLDVWIIIDASHANSGKKHENQPVVCESVARQVAHGNQRIIWVMIEANINEWKQSHTPWVDNPEDIKPWVSITDACVSLETNREMLSWLGQAAERRSQMK